MFDDSRKAIKQNYEEVYSVYDPGVDEGEEESLQTWSGIEQNTLKTPKLHIALIYRSSH